MKSGFKKSFRPQHAGKYVEKHDTESRDPAVLQKLLSQGAFTTVARVRFPVWESSGCYYISAPYANILGMRLLCCSTLSRFRSVVVITSAQHAEGRQFKPGRKQFLQFASTEGGH